jgi:methyl-accepting chemotaxis protein
VDDFAYGERIANYIRWPLLGVLLLFNNVGLAHDPALVWPINVALLLALALTAAVQYRLHLDRGYSFGPRVTLAIAAAQDALITAGVYLTGGYDSHFFIFYYLSLLTFSLVFSLRTSLIYTSVIAAVYGGLAWLLPPGLHGDALAAKILIERLLVLYVIVLTGSFVVRQERARRAAAVEAERKLARENQALFDTLDQRMGAWQSAIQEIDGTAKQSAGLARELGRLARDLETGRARIEGSVQELTDRAMFYIDQVEAIDRVTGEVVGASRDLARNAEPTGSASEQARQAVTGATEAVQTLNDRAREIGEMAAVVRQVADQTNMLAFNANIEAIQAGHEGRRFGVVADGVRLVAEQAIRLAREIDGLSQEVQEGTGRVLEAMPQIAQMLDRTVALVDETSQASQSQRASADAMDTSVDSLKGMARQNATDVQAIADAVHRQGDALQRIVDLGQQLAESAGALGALSGRFAE